jgi:hypothetical protein
MPIPGMRLTLELYQNVHIAIRAGIFPQHGAEKFECVHAMPPAEISNAVLRDLQM